MKIRFGIAVGILLLALTACGAKTGEQDKSITSMTGIQEQQDTDAAAMQEESSLPEEIDETTDQMISSEATIPTGTAEDEDEEEETPMTMKVQVGDTAFTATLEKNDAVTALVEMMREAPVVIQMSDYAGFEKVGSLGTSLPTSNHQTTTQAGDIVLYNGNQIVIFYGSNSWSYTRLGKIDDLTGWTDALGSGSVELTLSLD